MNPIETITSLFGNLTSAESVGKLVDQGAISGLIKMADKDTIFAICITVLAYSVQDAGVRTKAIETLGQMAQGKTHE